VLNDYGKVILLKEVFLDSKIYSVILRKKIKLKRGEIAKLEKYLNPNSENSKFIFDDVNQ
jgi:hypothetical protein